eukprot:COSAG05_NODE_2079_length_3603_cov_2.777968_6_plen_121_part_00
MGVGRGACASCWLLRCHQSSEVPPPCSPRRDANWDTRNRSASGDLVPDPHLYPSGLNHTVSYVHSLGLGFGLYGDRGFLDCGRAPGQLGHEMHDALWLGRNKIDWFAPSMHHAVCPALLL